ncbi:MAG: hypothetical protein OQK78_11415 [Gammaproteobacteria bacterium]|nr:hypothetical protein [Gammaproteobacteria bacterium]
MSEMTIWDYITIVVALVIIVVYIALRIRRTLTSKSCSCGLKPTGCSSDAVERCSESPVSTISPKDIGTRNRKDSD